MVRRDIFSESPCKHLAFAVNAEGENVTGFAWKVSRQYFPELRTTGPKKLASVFSKKEKTLDVTLHALVCYSQNEGGWKDTPWIITSCLDSIDVSDNQVIAIPLVWGDTASRMNGADTFRILGGIARSKKKVIVYLDRLVQVLL